MSNGRDFDRSERHIVFNVTNNLLQLRYYKSIVVTASIDYCFDCNMLHKRRVLISKNDLYDKSIFTLSIHYAESFKYAVFEVALCLFSTDRRARTCKIDYRCIRFCCNRFYSLRNSPHASSSSSQGPFSLSCGATRTLTGDCVR
jgi:hypothetical protein